MHPVLADILRDAHERHTEPRKIAAYVVTELRDLEGSGSAWVSDLLAEFVVSGAMRRCSDWRRTARKAVTTPKGTPVELAGWAGVPGRVGAVVTHLQLPLRDLTLDQLVAYEARLRKQRNTLSGSLVVVSALREYLEQHPTATAGEAIDALGLAA